MEHSERGKYVTEQVSVWIENDGQYVDKARQAAAEGADKFRAYLTVVIQKAPAHSAPWHVRQELAANDYDRVDWEGIRRDLTSD